MSRELRVDKSNRSGAGELARITAEIMLKAAGIINDGSVTFSHSSSSASSSAETGEGLCRPKLLMLLEYGPLQFS